MGRANGPQSEFSMSEWKTVIGLEVHAELETASKMFSRCPVVDSVEADPNSAVDPLSLGMPGALPVINMQAMEYGIMVGLALNCEIPPINQFARKNYFYPDLPKGYQISQYDRPLAINGFVNIDAENGSNKKVRVRRAHMEEDTGKLSHVMGGSLVDYNRAGVPLLEIVSEPDYQFSADEAARYAQEAALDPALPRMSTAAICPRAFCASRRMSVCMRARRYRACASAPKSRIFNSIRNMVKAIDFEVASGRLSCIDAARRSSRLHWAGTKRRSGSRCSAIRNAPTSIAISRSRTCQS